MADATHHLGGDGAETESVALSIRGISKHFGGVAALDDVDVDVRGGEILGFIGPNGAGKTTLFDIVSGFLAPDRGEILLRAGGALGDVTRRSAPERAELGLGRSFQDGRLFPALSVRETIALACETHVEARSPVTAALHLPWVVDSEEHVRDRVEELIDLLGLGAFGDKLLRELSTGSRRVVDLACVLAHAPSVVLLDEPSSGIAQREVEALGPLLVDVRDRLGATVLLIEHDVALLRSVANRFVALDLGRVIATGEPEAVVSDPHVVAAYLGDRSDTLARSAIQPNGSAGS